VTGACYRPSLLRSSYRPGPDSWAPGRRRLLAATSHGRPRPSGAGPIPNERVKLTSSCLRSSCARLARRSARSSLAGSAAQPAAGAVLADRASAQPAAAASRAGMTSDRPVAAVCSSRPGAFRSPVYDASWRPLPGRPLLNTHHTPAFRIRRKKRGSARLRHVIRGARRKVGADGSRWLSPRLPCVVRLRNDDDRQTSR
jgi:hypothetical protein